VASLLQNKSIEDALLNGIINASSVISHEGAKAGLLTFEEIENLKKI
jgi:sugar/nucleoside kinase (ribokinase family)